jgi:hypothetical protein
MDNITHLRDKLLANIAIKNDAGTNISRDTLLNNFNFLIEYIAKNEIKYSQGLGIKGSKAELKNNIVTEITQHISEINKNKTNKTLPDLKKQLYLIKAIGYENSLSVGDKASTLVKKDNIKKSFQEKLGESITNLKSDLNKIIVITTDAEKLSEIFANSKIAKNSNFINLNLFVENLVEEAGSKGLKDGIISPNRALLKLILEEYFNEKIKELGEKSALFDENFIKEKLLTNFNSYQLPEIELNDILRDVKDPTGFFANITNYIEDIENKIENKIEIKEKNIDGKIIEKILNAQITINEGELSSGSSDYTPKLAKINNLVPNIASKGWNAFWRATAGNIGNGANWVTDKIGLGKPFKVDGYATLEKLDKKTETINLSGALNKLVSRFQQTPTEAGFNKYVNNNSGKKAANFNRGDSKEKEIAKIFAKNTKTKNHTEYNEIVNYNNVVEPVKKMLSTMFDTTLHKGFNNDSEIKNSQAGKIATSLSDGVARSYTSPSHKIKQFLDKSGLTNLDRGGSIRKFENGLQHLALEDLKKKLKEFSLDKTKLGEYIGTVESQYFR